MKKIITAFFVFYCVSVSVNLFACDICGNYMGITPYDNKSSLSFLHRYRVFNGYRDYHQQSRFFPKSAYRTTHGGDSSADSLQEANRTHSSNDFESYKVFELRLKYFVLKRLELNVFVPLLSNKSKTDQLNEHCTGLGDVSFNADFHVITPKAERIIRHKLIIGAGIKLPTGNFYRHNSLSDRLPYEMQPGTGSIDGFGYINYVWMTKKMGMNVSLNYKVNGKNIYKEQMGNSHNDFMSLFYKVVFKNIVLYPSVQGNYEFTQGLKIKKLLQENTGVSSLLLGPGLDIYYKAFSFNTSWQFTVTEKVRDGNLKSAGRINLGINYSFGRKEK